MTVASGIIATWLIDFLAGATIWVSTRLETLTLYCGYAGIFAILLHLTYPERQSFLFVIPLLLIALSSDAISNSGHWKVLLPAGAFFGLLVILTQPKFTPPSSYYQVLYAPYYFLYYSLIPFIAASTRLFFPPAKHLIHTSLDYRFVRLELLSIGMKKFVAIGFKKL